MRRMLIAATAASVVAASGLAYAQDTQQKEGHGAAGAGMERTAPGAHGSEKGAGQGQMGTQERAGQAPAAQAQTNPATEEKQNRSAGEQGGNPAAKGERKSNGEAQSEERNGAGAQRTNEAPKSAQGEEKKPESDKTKGQQGAERSGKPEERTQTGATTSKGNAESNRNGEANRNGEGNNATATAPQSRPNEAATGAAASNRNPAASQNAARTIRPQDVRAKGDAHLSQENAARIATALNATATPRNVSINVDVGGLLPGDVDLMPLPPAVVELVPEYRGYDYVVDNDEIVIVQPSTRKVVEMINEGEGGHAMNEQTQAMAGTRVNPCGP